VALIRVECSGAALQPPDFSSLLPGEPLSPRRCSDTRLGIQGQTVATDFEKVFRMHDTLYVGLSGLASDVQTM
jgi:hypothetical protein